MSTLTKDRVLQALATVVDPAQGTDIVSAGMVQGVSIRGSAVGFAIEVDAARGPALEPLRKAAERAVLAIDGVESATVVLTAHADRPGGARPNSGSPAAGRFSDSVSRVRPGDRSRPMTPLKPVPPAPNDGRIEGVEHIIAIASGKGGVGKSTVAANLALALAADGRRVGLLDADVYGPSQPRMMGLSGRPSTPDGRTIMPLRNFGVTVMSMGLMVEEDQSVVWRGPMLMSALTQMLHQVAWGSLDYLIVDLPPGTGDVQLTLSQKARVSGAIIVSTPQDVALLDARKALDMFAKTGTTVLGMIENMSTYCCPKCGHEEHIFGHGGARAEAERLGIPFLGEVPLDVDIRLTSDGGTPIVAAKPQSPQARRFREIAALLVATPDLGVAVGHA
jgi:ATP-binding protein involved in chromosome partitioning